MTAPFALTRVGLIVNSLAGRGGAGNLQTARRAIQGLGVAEVVTGPGELGAGAVESLRVRVETIDVGGRNDRDGTCSLARALAGRPLDAVVVVGGDGTLADVAMAFLGRVDVPPLLGIGTGTANAGALMTCRAAEVDALAHASLTPRRIDALLAEDGRGARAVAFNDVTMATSVVGTDESGEPIDLDALALLGGRRSRGVPARVDAASAMVRIRDRNITSVVAKGGEVGGVAIGLVDGRYLAKAVTGGACLASLAGAGAGCVVSEDPMVRASIASEELHARPMRTVFVTLPPGADLEVSGLAEGAVLCADGNPLAEVGGQVTVTVRLLPMAVTALLGSRSPA